MTTDRPPLHHRRGHPLLAAGLGCIAALAITACGSANDSTTTANAGGHAAAPAAAATGSQRVDFTLPDLNGDARQFSEWDGDLVVLNFWATWCPPCLREMPLFQDRYAQYADDGFTIVAVAIDGVDETRNFAGAHAIEFPILVGQAEAMAASSDYGNRMGVLPYSVVIDRNGVVRETHRGEVTRAELDRWLRAYL
ncbi:thioredoxin [Thioalkalivibrio nitratireducens DSM 14787]|uniref:Thioredoxin n=1 Tax=Thioalkalivibrio nitratireducens (strain DSM 14787 / UNIQEM 213 / ALEN2) TaxID=1255043 RepID=L0DT42_THIND|nr:TlpA disulfide reductase family protein [Thioalkalivibrio nitratireducens]AGA32178.1 thioredoxin [Thioalkalivibrio nitratireducens DSM 14787]